MSHFLLSYLILERFGSRYLKNLDPDPIKNAQIRPTETSLVCNEKKFNLCPICELAAPDSMGYKAASHNDDTYKNIVQLECT